MKYSYNLDFWKCANKNTKSLKEPTLDLQAGSMRNIFHQDFPNRQVRFLIASTKSVRHQKNIQSQSCQTRHGKKKEEKNLFQ